MVHYYLVWHSNGPCFCCYDGPDHGPYLFVSKNGPAEPADPYSERYKEIPRNVVSEVLAHKVDKDLPWAARKEMLMDRLVAMYK